MQCREALHVSPATARRHLRRQLPPPPAVQGAPPPPLSQLHCRRFLALPKTSLYWTSPRFGADVRQVPVGGGREGVAPRVTFHKA